MRKRIAFLSFAAALAFCYSCSNDETVAVNTTPQDNEISFRAFNNGMTRAADITGFNSTPFMVRADATGPVAYFPETQFSYNSEANAWTSTNKYYWPSDDAVLTFHAYAPTSDAQFTHTVGENTFVVTPNATDNGAATHVDLVYATNTGKKSTNAAGVNLTFGHTESKVIIKLKNSNPNLKIKANKVVLGNVSGSGTYTMGAGWSSLGTATATYTQSYTGVEYSAETQAGVDMILIPQSMTVAATYHDGADNAVFDGPYITVDLKIQNSTSPYSYIVGAAESSAGADDNYVTALFPLPTITWASGTKYVYTVNLAGGGYLPQNKPSTSSDLDPILEGGEIKFVTVTVGGWSEGGNSDLP